MVNKGNGSDDGLIPFYIQQSKRGLAAEWQEQTVTVWCLKILLE